MFFMEAFFRRLIEVMEDLEEAEVLLLEVKDEENTNQ